ncbi:tetratricopeptide repeat protein [Belliella marina]|uniref:histidine kinase n=1 Tax=Belliella marina TaxID=1644146 RepID=A0ABW4VTH2_9BACT
MALPTLSFFCFIVLYFQGVDSSNLLLEAQNNFGYLEIKKPTSVEEIDAMNNHAFDLKGTYPDSLFMYATTALQASRELDYQVGIAHSLTNFGVYYYQKSSHGQSIDYYLQAKEVYRKEKLFNKSASTSNNIGLIYFREGDFEKALEYHQEALDICDENERPTNIANYKLNKALAMTQTNSFEEALPTYFEAIRDLEKTGENTYIANAYLNFGNRFGANGQLDSVKKYFDKGLEAAEKTNDFETLSFAYTSQIKYYVVTGKPQVALKYAEKALSNALTSGSIFSMADAYHTISALQEDTGDTKLALENLKKHYSYKDSLRQKEQTLEIARIESQKSLEKEKAIFQLELENKEKSNQQNILIIGLLIVLVFVIAILFLIVAKNLRKSKEKNLILSNKNKEIAKLVANLKNLNDHQNKIFGIIGHDLKGPVNSLITVTELISDKNLDLEEISEITPHLNREIRRAGATLENLLHWALSQKEGESIHPEHFNLKHLFSETIASLQYAIEHKQINTAVDIPDEIQLFADRQMIEISLRNLIANAVKFTSKNGRITCTAMEEDGKITVSIEDNGTGIAPETLQKLNQKMLISNFGTNNEKGTGMGLALCRGYIEKNKGSMEIHSDQGVGTKVKLSFNP